MYTDSSIRVVYQVFIFHVSVAKERSRALSVKNSGGHDDGALLALQQGGLRQHDLVLTHGRKQAAFELGSRSRPPSSIVTLLP